MKSSSTLLAPFHRYERRTQDDDHDDLHDDLADHDGGDVDGVGDCGIRRLVSSRRLEQNHLVFCERPLVVLQSTGNNVSNGALVCHHCHCFVGTPAMALQVAAAAAAAASSSASAVDNDDNDMTISAGELLQRITTTTNTTAPASSSSLSDHHSYYDLIPCRHVCGHIYCSTECRDDDWMWGGHAELCTGWIDEKVANGGGGGGDEEYNNDNDDNNNNDNTDAASARSLLQFKRHALETNEIFLLIAIWLARILKQKAPYPPKDTDPSNTHPYTDFSMTSWWDVARQEIILGMTAKKECSDDKTNLDTAMNAANAQADAMEQTLRDLCEESYNLLCRAWKINGLLSCTATASSTTTTPTTPRDEEEDDDWLTSSLGMARLIGSLEQNCLGVRRKHAVRHNILHNEDNVRQSCHTHIVQCLAKAGMIGNDDDGESANDEDKNDDGDVNDDKDEGNEDIGVFVSSQTWAQMSNGDNDLATEDPPIPILDANEEWDYSVDEVADFLAGLEEPLKVGGDDDWDAIFGPMDGTAHFTMVSKMNHSCDPNVGVLYKTRGWGKDHPLVAYCIALRDISEGEELTICYIDKDISYQERQAALANYGFVCTCPRCAAAPATVDLAVSSFIKTPFVLVGRFFLFLFFKEGGGGNLSSVVDRIGT